LNEANIWITDLLPRSMSILYRGRLEVYQMGYIECFARYSIA